MLHGEFKIQKPTPQTFKLLVMTILRAHVVRPKPVFYVSTVRISYLENHHRVTGQTTDAERT